MAATLEVRDRFLATADPRSEGYLRPKAVPAVSQS